jgi:hypothetical protein
VKTFAKSLLLAFLGTGAFFSFLMMVTVPAMALFNRLSGDIAKTSEVVNPALFLRTCGVPAALILFVALLAGGMYRFRTQERGRLPAVRQ